MDSQAKGIFEDAATFLAGRDTDCWRGGIFAALYATSGGRSGFADNSVDPSAMAAQVLGLEEGSPTFRTAELAFGFLSLVAGFGHGADGLARMVMAFVGAEGLR